MTLQYFCAENKVNDWTNHWKRQRLVWWRKFANVRSNFSLNEEQTGLEPGVNNQINIQVRYISQSLSATLILDISTNDVLLSYCSFPLPLATLQPEFLLSSYSHLQYTILISSILSLVIPILKISLISEFAISMGITELSCEQL